MQLSALPLKIWMRSTKHIRSTLMTFYLCINWNFKPIHYNLITPSIHKMSKHILKILHYFLQDFNVFSTILWTQSFVGITFNSSILCFTYNFERIIACQAFLLSDGLLSNCFLYIAKWKSVYHWSFTKCSEAHDTVIFKLLILLFKQRFMASILISSHNIISGNCVSMLKQ